MKIKIKHGHDYRSYFWIMPAKVKLEDVIMEEDIEERTNFEISIEEGDVDCFLAYFFVKYYDKALVYNFNRYDPYQGYRAKFGERNRFEWNLENNFYTYKQAERMISEIEWAADTLEKDFDSPYLEPIKKNFSIFYMTEHGSDDYKAGETNEESIKRNVACVIEFYRSFANEIRHMMGNNPDIDLISIMGP